ncbi:hypothetical protein LINPERHAP1_LOCUS13120 [Linum perenne]
MNGSWVVALCRELRLRSHGSQLKTIVLPLIRMGV